MRPTLRSALRGGKSTLPLDNSRPLAVREPFEPLSKNDNGIAGLPVDRYDRSS
jgi:hypothetical protein